MANLIKCKNCPYYTGVTCHGHGEFWGECTLLDMLKKYHSNNLHISNYDIKYKLFDSVWALVKYDDSECLFIKYEGEDTK